MVDDWVLKQNDRSNPAPVARPSTAGGGLSLLAMVAVLVAASSGLSTVRLLGQASIGLALTAFPEPIQYESRPDGALSGDGSDCDVRHDRAVPGFASALNSSAAYRSVMTRQGLADLPPPAC